MEDLLERFEVDVTVSIDGSTPATFEAVRVGASFERVAAQQLDALHVGEERLELDEERLVVGLRQRRQVLALGPDGRRRQAGAHRALQVAPRAELQLELRRPGERTGAAVGAGAAEVVEAAGVHLAAEVVEGARRAGVAAGREVVGGEAAAELVGRRAPPDVVEALVGVPAEAVPGVLAARPHVAERVQVQRHERRQAGRPPPLAHGWLV